nr:hypothetical protein Clen_229 [Cedratvirus lena]
MTRTILLSNQDISRLIKQDGKVSFTDYYQDTYYKRSKSCVRKRLIYNKEGIFLSENWVDVYGNSIHKPQVEQVLLKYSFTRHHLSMSNIKLDVLCLNPDSASLVAPGFVVLTRVDSLFLEESGKVWRYQTCKGKVHLLTNKIDLQGYIFLEDPFLTKRYMTIERQ